MTPVNGRERGECAQAFVTKTQSSTLATSSILIETVFTISFLD